MHPRVSVLCLSARISLSGCHTATYRGPTEPAIHVINVGPRSEIALVFIPGLMMPRSIWNRQVEHFQKAHRVIAIDPRSQEDSAKTAEGNYPAQRARDLRELLEKKQMRRVVLVAASSGVTDVAAYVDQFGTDRIVALVLVHGVAGADYDTAMLMGLIRWAHSFQTDRPKQTESFVRSLFVKTPPPDAELHRLTNEALKMPTSAACAAFLGSVASDYRPALAKIDKPTLIIVGESRWHPQYEDLQKRVSGSQLKKIEGADHALYLESATEFNAALEEFLSRVR